MGYWYLRPEDPFSRNLLAFRKTPILEFFSSEAKILNSFTPKSEKKNKLQILDVSFKDSNWAQI